MVSTPPPGYRDAAISEWEPGSPVDADEAVEFLHAVHREVPRLGPVEPRIVAVRDQIATLGTYWHTRHELVHGARMAWRNSSRCIGRVYWRSLIVLDRRATRTPQEIFE